MVTPNSAAGPMPIGVLGAGIMGRGIAQAFAAVGHQVALCDIDEEVARRGKDTIRGGLERSAARGAKADMTILDRIAPVADFASFSGAGLVIEAVPEDLRLKQEMLARLADVVDASAILATNTSALSVTALASAVPSPERFVGLHFFNPVHRMPLVEMVSGLDTSPATEAAARQVCEAAGKVVVRINDSPGFVTSRINVLIGNEAFHMLTEGVATAEEIDTALTNGLHHPMGPFELIDLVGLDTRLSVLRGLHASLGDRFRPDPLLVRLVEAGRLGRKTGRGVYRYDEAGHRVPETGAQR